MSNSPVKTLENARGRDNTFGTAGTTDLKYIHGAIMKNFLGTKTKLVTGYKGSSGVRLAMERGEVDGSCGESWDSLKSTKTEWVEKKLMNILVQYGLERHPDLPDAPLIMDFAKNDEERQMLKLLVGGTSIASAPFGAPPRVPAERVAALRAAFEANFKDPDFLAFAKQANLNVAPRSGKDIADFVTEVYGTPKHVIDRAGKTVK